MTDKDRNLEQPAEGKTVEEREIAHGRRRLIKIGVTAAPVVMTLASRPVLAWHCKSPSAWGSEQLNPNTSISHATYTDETWKITNWVSNSGRTLVLGGALPWTKLAAKLSITITDYKQVTIGGIRAAVPTLPVGVNDSQSVYSGLSGKKPNGVDPADFSWSEFAKYLVVAQLNRYLLAAGVWDPQCVTQTELSAMATLTYPSATSHWTEQQVKDYLYNNWIVRP